ncbi:Uncharacterized protein DBV15_00575 [Temnothorax longispinosus]|uniref:Uncharacterized protein n=1 Tax=Temnothorax longispinosus TaxID=300112 RepID=A0A4S2KTR4_9HYME|nr:Uncharacterized protein DBV15_00575 [Temnothorax longispinosus]
MVGIHVHDRAARKFISTVAGRHCRQAAYKGEARPSKYICAYIFSPGARDRCDSEIKRTHGFQIHYRTNSCLRHSERPGRGVDIICLPGDTSVEINARREPVWQRRFARVSLLRRLAEKSSKARQIEWLKPRIVTRGSESRERDEGPKYESSRSELLARLSESPPLPPPRSPYTPKVEIVLLLRASADAHFVFNDERTHRMNALQCFKRSKVSKATTEVWARRLRVLHVERCTLTCTSSSPSCPRQEKEGGTPSCPPYNLSATSTGSRQLLVISIPHARRPEELTFSVSRTHDPRARERLESSPSRRAERPEYIKETHSGNHSGTRCMQQRTTCRRLVYTVRGIRARFHRAAPAAGGNPREGTGNYMIMKCSWARRVHTERGRAKRQYGPLRTENLIGRCECAAPGRKSDVRHRRATRARCKSIAECVSWYLIST